ncbi:DUF732 domain-containing protein [Mycobacterium sp. Aquia_216]|uniref:DUF732 domain-containing protein n=1 Tax=Mycobacterium sp. Aquia_216 TaxID=2991729 RepID=UPI00227A0986|nr:DUF732 domain-containing protein [Mycobacterium sp. Aquia_216]WAJ46673.1 DUF732 domain-containing protein [Mycobacterium sp. Aquia_216]
MSEPVPATDKTVGLNGSETVAAPTSAAAEAATATNSAGLAWSRDDDVDTPSNAANQRQSWRATWRTAAVLLAAGLAIAGAIVLGRSLLSTPPKAPAPAPTATPTSKSGPPPAASGTASAAAPSSIVSTPDQDNRYVQALNDRGISFANPDAAIYNGKMVCENIRLGMTVQQIIVEFRASNPALSNDADAYVTISVRTYCPQNSNLVGNGP